MPIQHRFNMISVEELERLTALRCEDGVISLYLCARPQSSNTEGQFLFQFRQALNGFRRRTKDPTRLHAARREESRIEDYLRWRRPVRGSLALYSCQPARLWEIFDIDIPVPVVFDVASTARTGILLQVLDQQLRIGRYHQRVVDGLTSRPGERPLIGACNGRRGVRTIGLPSKFL